MKESFHFPAFLSSLFFSVSQTFCERHHHHRTHHQIIRASLKSYLEVLVQEIAADLEFAAAAPGIFTPTSEQKKTPRISARGFS
jgi:hypothetical protein